MATKFKIGDRVVLTSTKTCGKFEGHAYAGEGYLKLGETAVITEILNSSLVGFENIKYYCYIDDLEFEEIYNSPLYQALKED